MEIKNRTKMKTRKVYGPDSVMQTHQVKVRNSRRVLCDPPATGWTTVEDGFTIADINVLVDLKALADLLGPKAIRSKAKRSQLQSGIVVVEAFNLRKVSQ